MPTRGFPSAGSPPTLQTGRLFQTDRRQPRADLRLRRNLQARMDEPCSISSSTMADCMRQRFDSIHLGVESLPSRGFCEVRPHDGRRPRAKLRSRQAGSQDGLRTVRYGHRPSLESGRSRLKCANGRSGVRDSAAAFHVPGREVRGIDFLQGVEKLLAKRRKKDDRHRPPLQAAMILSPNVLP